MHRVVLCFSNSKDEPWTDLYDVGYGFESPNRYETYEIKNIETMRMGKELLIDYGSGYLGDSSDYSFEKVGDDGSNLYRIYDDGLAHPGIELFVEEVDGKKGLYYVYEIERDMGEFDYVDYRSDWSEFIIDAYLKAIDNDWRKVDLPKGTLEILPVEIIGPLDFDNFFEDVYIAIDNELYACIGDFTKEELLSNYSYIHVGDSHY